MVKIGKKGRKPKYTEWLTQDGLTLLEGWARRGLTEAQIAENCNIALSSLKEWKKQFPSISSALKKGKEVIDIQVENALLKRALGYGYKEEIYENGKLVKEVRRHMPPDTVAQIFWLKNRRPDLWRDKAVVESVTQEDKVADILQEMLKDVGSRSKIDGETKDRF